MITLKRIERIINFFITNSLKMNRLSYENYFFDGWGKFIFSAGKNL